MANHYLFFTLKLLFESDLHDKNCINTDLTHHQIDA